MTTNRIERLTATFVATIVVITVLYLVVRGEPFRDAQLVVLLRIVLAVSMGIIGATIPGFMQIEYSTKGNTIRAGGAMALSLLCYVGTPKVEQLNLSLPTAKIKLEQPQLIDIRTLSPPNTKTQSQLNSSIAVTVGLSYSNTEQPAKSAFLKNTNIQLLNSNEAPWNFEWSYFVNMHDEQYNKWLGIDRSAAPLPVKSGSTTNVEILHQSIEKHTWEEFLKIFKTPSTGIIKFVIKSTLDTEEILTNCTIDTTTGSNIIEKYRKIYGRSPAKITMCCLEHPSTKSSIECKEGA